MPELEQMGAIDYMLLEGHGKKVDGAMVPPLLDLVDWRLIRILDVLVLVKRGEGAFDALTSSDLDPAQVGDLGSARGRIVGPPVGGDAADAAAILRPDSTGLLVVYENLWSVEFAVAARKAGGQLVAYGHIPTQAILATLGIDEPAPEGD